MIKLGHMVLERVNWVHNSKMSHMLLKGVNWVHNVKIRLNGYNRSHFGKQYKIQVKWS